MRLSHNSLFIYCIFIFLISCTENESYLPGYSGNQGEVIVVMKSPQWNSSPGEAIKNNLGLAQYGLPQDEPVFDLVHVAPKDFAKIFQTHRNIIIIDFSETNGEVKTEIKRNSWAKGQLVIKITSPNEPSFIDFLNRHSENIISKINEVEIERQIEKNKAHGKTIQKEVHKISGTPLNLSIVLQKDAYVAKEDSNFLWIRMERGRNLGGYEHQISQGVFIYFQNYSDTVLFSPEKIISVNDSVSKRHISGSVPDSYMITSFKLFAPSAKRINFSNKFAMEIRGLWRMENDFMGGPFISLTFLDKKSNMIITAEGYVFAPQFDKLMYLREVEAMVKSIAIKD